MSNKTIVYFSSVVLASKQLTPREKDILEERLKKTKLRKIAKKYSVSPERIRQIEQRALKKIIQKQAQLMLFD